MEASMLRVGEKIVKVRITFHEETVFVSARDDKRLLDYFRFTKKEFNKEKAMAEFGDLLFSLVNYARFIDIDPEEALERTNKKFIKRFQYLETESAKDGKQMGEMSLAEMDKYWSKAKEL